MQEQSNQSATEAPNSCGPSAYEEVVGQPSRQSDAVEQNVTVASLLSQLSSSESPYRHDAQHNSTSDEPASVTSLSRQGDSVGVLPRVHRTQNIREMSFQQSLPLLARQSEDLSFAETITKVSLYIVQDLPPVIIFSWSYEKNKIIWRVSYGRKDNIFASIKLIRLKLL